MPVVDISNAFRENTRITSISIPAGVTSINGNAFRDCTGLTSVNIPASVTGIGAMAFAFCNRLKSVNIPEGVTSIEYGTFSQCYRLTSITIPASVTTIGSDAFSSCTGLTSVTIPASVTSIRDEFYGCTNLAAIQVDANNKNYSSRDGVLFSKAGDTLITYPIGKKETQYIIPASVTSIGEYAFAGTGLTSVSMPASVTSIGICAFSGHNGWWHGYNSDQSDIESISVDPRNTFYSSRDGVLFNKNATTLVVYPPGRKENQYMIPEGVTRIESRAFTSVRHLKILSIPASVTSIGDSGAGVSSVTIVHAVQPPKYEGGYTAPELFGNVYVPAASLDAYRNANEWGDKVKPETALHARQTSAGFEISDGVLEQYLASSATPVIPADWGITSIGNNAFSERTNISSVSIPAGVTSIGNSAFKGCTSLISVSIPASVTSIDGWTFRGCIGLTSVNIPASVTAISYSAFEGCTSLTSVNIPANVTSIKGNVFRGCTGLTSILVGTNNNHYTSRDGVLFNKTGGTLVAYPAGIKARQYAIPGDVTSIGEDAFYGCTGLTSVSIPASVTSIERWAFSGCTGLTSVSIGANVKLEIYYGTGPFGNNFDAYYNTNGKKAGVYTWSGDAWSYSER